jgi:undecaprenyl diphosphate synthase
MKSFRDRIDKNRIPKHVAVIMDGNGRWAERHGKARVMGHEHGVESVRSVVEGAGEIGVDYLTLYAFSTENWDRPKSEVDALMALLVQALEAETDALLENNVRLSAIGNLEMIPDQVRRNLEKCTDRLNGNTGLNLVLALSYSGQWDILTAAKKMAEDIASHKTTIEAIDYNIFGNYLSTKNQPNPELLIRTSGEYRISNFLLWQIAYAELYFTQKLWPDFRKEDLFEAIVDYQNRERRFGKTREQITS